MNSPLILAYHSITPKGNSPLSVSPSQFTKQLEWLRNQGYRATTLAHYTLTNDVRRTCIVTFDDGYADNLTYAAAILKDFCWPAVVFVVTDFVGTKQLFPWIRKSISTADPGDFSLSWDELRLLQNHGWEIGSHTCTHPNLTLASHNVIVEELRKSKCVIENTLTTNVSSLCYPFSQADRRVVHCAAMAGYSLAVKSGPWLRGCGTLALPRISIYSDDSIDTFRVKILLRHSLGTRSAPLRLLRIAKRIRRLFR